MDKWINTSLKLSSAVGHLRGYMIGELLYNDLTPSRFKLTYDALQHSYELAGDTMDEFDINRIKKRADELGVTI